jgi:hypothetical protein
LIHFDSATKRQLLHIAFEEDCSLDDKYQAVKELQLRQWNDSMLSDLVLLYGRGMSLFHISVEIGVDKYVIQNKVNQYGLKRRCGA